MTPDQVVSIHAQETSKSRRTLAAAFFYLRVIVLMFMQEPSEDFELDTAPVVSAAVAVPAVFTLVLGVVPGIVSGPIEQASVLRW